MGNCHVYLRFYDHEKDEPMYSRIEIGEHIKYHQLQQHAFEEFKPFIAHGVDHSDLHFSTTLGDSNRELAISDSEAIRSMFHEFVKMDRHGHAAVLDVLIKKPGFERPVAERTSENILLSEFKEQARHNPHSKVKKGVTEVKMEEEWAKFYDQHRHRFGKEDKTQIFIEFTEHINKHHH
eukprot:TRINITY_DN1456_c0_g1_i1.p2 TRINITY_DN1456_c0_g1~~TRINITY_DN1456_c0_g1_i1.p2  ORF type:complete len:179 (+),score=21.59 TRINITY_DN1456_c0_g1_i1:156-692(+)